MWSRIVAISLVLVMVFSAFLILGTPATAARPSIMPRALPDYMKYVTINNFQFDPLAQTPSIPASLRYDTVPRDQQFYYIVQFNGPVTPAMKSMLAATGVTILQYLAYNAFVVRADGPAIDRAAALPVVRWSGVFQPAYKLSPRLSDEYALITERAMERDRSGDSLNGGATTTLGAGGMPAKSVSSSGGAATAASGFSPKFDTSASGSTMGPQTSFGGAAAPSSGAGSRISLEVTAFETSRVPEIARAASVLGGTQITYSWGNSGGVRVEVDKGALPLLARVPGVLYVDRFVQPYVFNDLARWVVQSGDTDTFATPIHDHGIHGTGQTVTLGDTGIDYKHPDFWDPGNTTPGPSARKLTDYYPACSDNCDDTDNGINHGTHTSGSVAGDDGTWHVYNGDATGSNGTAGPHDGQAFDAWIQMTDMSNDGNFVYFDSITNVWQRAVDRDSWIHSNSWGSVDFQAEYIQEAADTDNFIWNNQDFLVVFAAANAGQGGLRSMNLFGTAKNIITAGATVNGLGLENMADFSSRGPTQDGRIKPDITAPGVSVWSAQGLDPGGDGTQYWQLSGTSMATPTIAGSMALVRQYYMDGWYPTGAPVPGDGFTPTAALIKATAINSAREMTGTGAYGFGESYYPNDNQGFGRLTLDDALAFQGDARGLVLDDNRNGLNTGDVTNYSLAIGDASQSVEITLVWSDYPGTAGCNPCLVNDLDLTVHAPDGTLYAGNQYVGMNPGESKPNPTRSDHRNNVESVLVITGVQEGVWTVTVTANDVPNGPQPYAIVMTGGIATQRGIIQMDHNSYQSSATVNIKVVDTGLNTDPNNPDTVDVNMSSSTETTPELVTLTETGNATSVFDGSIPLDNSVTPAPGDGLLQVQDGDTITALYYDNDDGSGGRGPVTATALVDDTPPVISGIAAINLRFNRATIVWTTDERSDSVVWWGDTSPPGNQASSSRMVTGHSITLSGLTANKTYYYAVQSTDEAGNVALDNNNSQYYTFVTPEKPPTAPPSVEWPTFHNNVPRQGRSPSNFQPPIDLIWADGPYLLQLWNGPVLSDGILFSAPLDGTLRARDPFTGEILWSRHLGDQYYYTGTMVGHDGVLYATFYGSSGGYVYALNEYTGDTIWVVGSESGLDFNARIMMGYSDGLVFGSAWGGQIYALNATDGSVVWAYQTGDLPFGGPSVNAGVVYMASIGGTVFAVDEFSGSLVWSATLDDTTTSSPLYANGLIYEGTYSGTMYALDAFTGEIVWSTGGFNLIDVSTPAYDGVAIYFGDYNDEYVSLDASDGTLLWRTGVGGAVGTSPALANGFLYGTCWFYCPLYTFDTLDGSIVDSDPLTSSFGATSFPAVSDGWVWVEDYAGNIHGFFGQLPIGLTVSPARASQDAVPDSKVDYNLTVKNIGISGPDTFDATKTLGVHGWTVDLLKADRTPLTDTDSDGIPDTGPLNPGKNTTVIVEVTVPAAVNPGDADTAVVRFTSSNDLTRHKESQLTTTVPPPGVSVGPRGYFTPNPGATVNATMNVRNTGGFADTIDVTAVSDQSWTIHLYKADGVTPLADTDGDGIPDVGLVPGLRSASIVVSVNVPGDAPEDTVQRTAVKGTSSLNTSASGTGLVVIEIVAPPNEAWPTFHNNQKRAGLSPSTHAPPMKELWRTGGHQLQLWTGPVVADNIVYSTTLDGYLRAYDPFTGDVIWEQAFGDSFYYTGTVTVDQRSPSDPNDNVVYATFYGTNGGVIGSCPPNPPFYGSCGYVFAIDATDGSILWKVGPDETGLNFNARVVMAYAHGRVVGATWNDFNNGQVYALDSLSGQLLWLFNATGLPFGGAAISGGNVYIGTISGWLYALDEQSGSVVWSAQLDNTITSVPLVAQGIIFVGTYSGTMYAIDGNTGSVIWSTGGFSLIDSSTPATDGSAIYFGDFMSEYVSLDMATGAVLWRTSIAGPVASSPALANGYLYGTAWDGKFRTLNASTGDIVDTDPLVAFASTSSPAVQRGWVWLEDYNGAVYAFGGKGAGEVRTVLVTPAVADVEVGKALLFKTHALDAFDNPIRVKDADWLARAGLGSVVKVNGDTALYVADIIAGTETLEASTTDEDGVVHVGTATVNVRPGPLDRIEVAMLVGGIPFDGDVSIPAGSQRTFVADATDRFGNPIAGATLTWSVENGVGQITSNGVFTASTTVGVGFVTAASSSKSGHQTVTIVPAAPATVDIETSSSVSVDSQTVVVATVRDVYRNANLEGVVKWTKTGTGPAPLLLTPDGRTILYHAPITTTPASVQLTAGIDVDGDGVVDISQAITLTIVAGPPVGISIDAPATTVAVGGTLDFGAVVTDQFGNAVTGATVAWETTAGSINQQGVFTAPQNPGLVVITASTAGRESFVVIDVTSGGFEQFSRQATSATSLVFLLATIVAVTASVFLFVRYRESKRELEELRRGRGGTDGEL
ncbi:MAG TPA: PQQ-binding-like beta-propeller repeat protein [Thermoplasmata archaeon]